MYLNSLKLKYYRSALIKTKRGNCRGRIINAKPIFLIALFDQIEKGKIRSNNILYDSCLKVCYDQYYLKFEPDMNITPFNKPFFYLQSDGYCHIEWKNESQIKSPTTRCLRENVNYATLDNDLWELLQNAKTRNFLRETIISYFIQKTNKPIIDYGY